MEIEPRGLVRRRRLLEEANKRFPTVLVPVDPEEWPRPLPPRLVNVLRSRTALVQVFEERDGVIRLSICRTWLNGDGDWQDGMTWDDLQRLKREAGYGDRDAVEVYPVDVDTVNMANMRHLWVLPAGSLPFAWRARSSRGAEAGARIGAGVDRGFGGSPAIVGAIAGTVRRSAW